MKNLNYLLLTVMTMLLVASCSQDETLSIESGNASTVTFTVDVPESGPQSRAIGDGKTVDKLVYAIYEDGVEVSNLGGDNTAGFPQTLTLSLLKDKTYEIAFWAQSSECTAYNTADLTAVEVKYDGFKNNDETRDAFFKTIKHEVAGNASVAVELERPFAQINVGASDWEEAVAAGFTVKESKVKITNAANRLNLLTGKASTEGDPAIVEYNYAAIPELTDKLKANGEEYTYLSMSYFLVDDKNSEDGTGQATLEGLEFVFKDANSQTMTLTQGLTSVPVRRNYRTNILGNLLTGEIDFDITIDDDFETPDYNSIKVVKTVQEFKDALKNKFQTEIIVDGAIGSENNYTEYTIDRPVIIRSATTRSTENAKVFGTFMITADDVTIDNLAIQNRGDFTNDDGKTPGTMHRGGIYVLANNVTITNNTITNGLGDKLGLSNAIQIMTLTENNPLSNYEIKDNKILGHENVVTNWSSSGIIITQNHKPSSAGGAEIKTITATDDDYQNLMTGNTFKNNKINVQHADWGKGGLILFPYTEVKSKAGLTAALEDKRVGVIDVKGIIGKDEYTIYNVDREVTIKGGKDAKVFGTFIVKSDDVTIDNLAIQNAGDLDKKSSNNRGGIYVFANNVTITNNTFTNGIGKNPGLSNAIQLMSPTVDNSLSNYVVKGNKITGHFQGLSDWDSSGIVIAQGYKPDSAGADVLAISATDTDYQKLLNDNTFTNNKIDVTHQDWSKSGDEVVLFPK